MQIIIVTNSNNSYIHLHTNMVTPSSQIHSVTLRNHSYIHSLTCSQITLFKYIHSVMRSLEKQTHWLRTQHYTNLHSHAYKFMYTDEHT